MLKKAIDGAGLVPVCDCCGCIAPMDYMEGEDEIAKQDLLNIHWQVNVDGKRFKCTKCRGLPSSIFLQSYDHKYREILIETGAIPVKAVPYSSSLISEHVLDALIDIR